MNGVFFLEWEGPAVFTRAAGGGLKKNKKRKSVLCCGVFGFDEHASKAGECAERQTPPPQENSDPVRLAPRLSDGGGRVLVVAGLLVVWKGEPRSQRSREPRL